MQMRFAVVWVVPPWHWTIKRIRRSPWLERNLIHVPSNPSRPPCRTVHIARIDNIEAAVNLLAADASAGAACLWVRNAVDDAIVAVEALRARGLSG